MTNLNELEYTEIARDILTFNSQDLIGNTPKCLPYSSNDVSLENLVLDQLIIP